MLEGPILAEADAAIEQHHVAKASGDRVEIAQALGRMLRAKDALGCLKVEQESYCLTKASLARPIALGALGKGWGGPPSARRVGTEGRFEKVFDGRGNLVSVRLVE
jgi:hypothetical protein